MSQQHLRYALELSQGSNTSLTYVNAGELATLTVVVSNPGADVTIDSITFGLGPFGQDATDLAAGPDEITVVAPVGWQSVSGTSFLLEPTGGSVVVGTTPLSFSFQVQVNAAAGTAELAITEVSSTGTAHVAPITITKMPSAFLLANLSATPVLVEPNGTVTLSWSSTPGQAYEIGYTAGSAVVIGPPGGSTTWVSPPVVTSATSATFTVSATAQEAGQVLTITLSTTVNMDVAQIISFSPPATFYSSPITLNWKTVNADYCVLYANGSVVDPQAPANSPASGYSTTPPGRTTTYQLYAFRGANSAASPQISITVYNWTQVRSYSWGDVSYNTAFAINGDGSVLYFGGQQGITAINTSTLTQTGQAPVANGVGPQGLALSGDGTQLYVANFKGPLLVFNTSNLAAGPQTLSPTSGPLVASPDGTMLYMIIADDENSLGEVLAFSTATNAVVTSAELRAVANSSAIAISPDGRWLFVMASDQLRGFSFVYNIATSAFEATLLRAVTASPITMDPTGETLWYSPTDVNGDALTTTVQNGNFMTGAVSGPITPNPLPASGSGLLASISGMAADPSGGLLLATAFSSETAATGSNNLMIIDPVTSTFRQLYTANNMIISSAIIVDSAGDHAYLADGAQIVVFSSAGGDS